MSSRSFAAELLVPSIWTPPQRPPPYSCCCRLQGTNPIYNLLPDMLSSLAAEPTLAAADFQSIMRTLLGYIGKDRHADALVDKLLARFEGVSLAPLWRNLAFCLSQASPWLCRLPPTPCTGTHPFDSLIHHTTDQVRPKEAKNLCMA